ncbi:hypothetical protein NQZ68_000571 [Dissostichus eleginoides]|nr:hypothetical protein NQZ68_000571 [Dissostichus eleginoides]
MMDGRHTVTMTLHTTLLSFRPQDNWREETQPSNNLLLTLLDLAWGTSNSVKKLPDVLSELELSARCVLLLRSNSPDYTVIKQEEHEEVKLFTSVCVKRKKEAKVENPATVEKSKEEEEEGETRTGTIFPKIQRFTFRNDYLISPQILLLSTTPKKPNLNSEVSCRCL